MCNFLRAATKILQNCEKSQSFVMHGYTAFPRPHSFNTAVNQMSPCRSIHRSVCAANPTRPLSHNATRCQQVSAQPTLLNATKWLPFKDGLKSQVY